MEEEKVSDKTPEQRPDARQPSHLAEPARSPGSPLFCKEGVGGVRVRPDDHASGRSPHPDPSRRQFDEPLLLAWRG
ncbi:MAG: hypothetical protein DIJKHBIC_04250 [Thermoanaerobaculia bacterium]|nr:hypothetical protein [Thermoanaerobaculia bacterium]